MFEAFLGYGIIAIMMIGILAIFIKVFTYPFKK